MNLKKILSGVILGAFIFGVSATDIAPVTNTVSAATSRSEVRQRQQEYDRAREDYERAKIRYDRASSSRERDSIGLRNKLDRMERAKRRYEDARRDYDGDYNSNRRRKQRPIILDRPGNYDRDRYEHHRERHGRSSYDERKW